MAVRTSHLALALFPLLVGEGKAQEEQIQNPSNADSNAENLETKVNEESSAIHQPSQALFSAMEEAKMPEEMVNGEIDGIRYNVLFASKNQFQMRLQLQIINYEDLARFLPAYPTTYEDKFTDSISSTFDLFFQYIEIVGIAGNEGDAILPPITDPANVNLYVFSLSNYQSNVLMPVKVDALLGITTAQPLRIGIDERDKLFLDLMEKIYMHEIEKEGQFKDYTPLKPRTIIPFIQYYTSFEDYAATAEVIDLIWMLMYLEMPKNIGGITHEIEMQNRRFEEEQARRFSSFKEKYKREFEWYLSSVDSGISGVGCDDCPIKPAIEWGNYLGWNYNIRYHLEGSVFDVFVQASKYAVGIDPNLYVSAIGHGNLTGDRPPSAVFFYFLEQETGRLIFVWKASPNPRTWPGNVTPNGIADYDNKFVHDVPDLISHFGIRGPIIIPNFFLFQGNKFCDIFESSNGVPDSYNSIFPVQKTFSNGMYKVLMLDKE